MDEGQTGSTSGASNEATEDAIELQAKRLCSSIRSAVVKHKHEREAVEQERAQLTAEKASLQEVQSHSSSRVKLDIGGVLYTATQQTLCKVPGSMFEAMFSGRHHVAPTEETLLAQIQPRTRSAAGCTGLE